MTAANTPVIRAGKRSPEQGAAGDRIGDPQATTAVQRLGGVAYSEASPGV